jgi:hypothetical protein
MRVSQLWIRYRNVSVLAAEIKGPEGKVTRIDVAQPSIQRAQDGTARRD